MRDLCLFCTSTSLSVEVRSQTFHCTSAHCHTQLGIRHRPLLWSLVCDPCIACDFQPTTYSSLAPHQVGRLCMGPGFELVFLYDPMRPSVVLHGLWHSLYFDPVHILFLPLELFRPCTHPHVLAHRSGHRIVVMQIARSLLPELWTLQRMHVLVPRP